MGQHIDIEDAIMPLRTYAWAVTGSVSVADELLIECFEGIVGASTDEVPANSNDWFSFIDGAVVNWAYSGQDTYLSGQHIAMGAIKTAMIAKPAILGKLLLNR